MVSPSLTHFTVNHVWADTVPVAANKIRKIKQTEHRTSNVQRGTLNIDVAELRNLISLVFIILFFLSPSTPLRAVSLSNGHFDIRNENLN